MSEIEEIQRRNQEAVYTHIWDTFGVCNRCGARRRLAAEKFEDCLGRVTKENEREAQLAAGKIPRVSSLS